MSWTCEQCGTVWAPWFAGPCNHPGVFVQADTGGIHEHEYEGYVSTAGPRCRICGQTPPEQPNTTVSFGANKPLQWTYTRDVL